MVSICRQESGKSERLELLPFYRQYHLLFIAFLWQETHLLPANILDIFLFFFYIPFRISFYFLCVIVSHFPISRIPFSISIFLAGILFVHCHFHCVSFSGFVELCFPLFGHSRNRIATAPMESVPTFRGINEDGTQKKGGKRKRKPAKNECDKTPIGDARHYLRIYYFRHLFRRHSTCFSIHFPPDY